MNIEKGIPIPKRDRKGFLINLAMQMKDGDSVLVKLTQVQGLRNRLKEVSGLNAVSRKEGSMYRVWAVKEEA